MVARVLPNAFLPRDKSSKILPKHRQTVPLILPHVGQPVCSQHSGRSLLWYSQWILENSFKKSPDSFTYPSEDLAGGSCLLGNLKLEEGLPHDLEFKNKTRWSSVFSRCWGSVDETATARLNLGVRIDTISITEKEEVNKSEKPFCLLIFHYSKRKRLKEKQFVTIRMVLGHI